MQEHVHGCWCKFECLHEALACMFYMFFTYQWMERHMEQRLGTCQHAA